MRIALFVSKQVFIFVFPRKSSDDSYLLNWHQSFPFFIKGQGLAIPTLMKVSLHKNQILIILVLLLFRKLSLSKNITPAAPSTVAIVAYSSRKAVSAHTTNS